MQGMGLPGAGPSPSEFLHLFCERAGELKGSNKDQYLLPGNQQTYVSLIFPLWSLSFEKFCQP